MGFKTIFLTLCLFSGGIGAQETIDLVVLHTNDTHGRLSPHDLNGKKVGGIARLAHLVKEVRSEHPGRVLLLHAGDIFSRGEPVVIHTGGYVNLLAFEKMGYDAITPGNGEFYFGIENLQRQTARVSTPFVHANVTYKAHGGTLFPPYVIREIQGVKVGILGLGLMRLWHQSSEFLRLNDPIEMAKKYVPQLRPQVDVLIALTHIGVKNDSLLAAAVPELDLIVGGDSHTRLDKPSRIKRSNGRGSVPVVQARHYYEFLGWVDLQVEKVGERYRVKKVGGHLLPVDDRIQPDKEIEDLVAQFEEPLSKVICRTERALPNSRDEQSALGDLVGQAVLHQTRADVVIIGRNTHAPGFPVGDITLADVYRIRQYRGPVVLARLTKAQIQSILDVRAYQTAGCAFQRQGKAVVDLRIQTKPDSSGTYLVAMGRQVAFRHFTRQGVVVPLDSTGQRIDTAFERYLREVKVIR